METTSGKEMAQWRMNGIGLLRIAFGFIWGVDAWFKWQSDFINNFTSYLTGAQEGQPVWIHHWIQFWVNTMGIDPTFFAYVVAVGEALIALALILGVFTNLVSVAGSALVVVIWTTAEGFGGPYVAGSTDIGGAIIYALVFVGLFLSQSGLYHGLDGQLTRVLGRFGWLASGGFGRGRHENQQGVVRA